MTSLPELHPDSRQRLLSIRSTHLDIKKLPADYDFILPTFVSHVDDYSSNLPRLRNYAGQVIGARIMQFGHTTLYKTHYFLDMFLRGYTDKNIFEMVFSARALIEVYAVTRDTYAIIAKNAGDHEENYVSRVKAVDEALINATYGTRSDLVKTIYSSHELSKLREVTEDDISIIQAKNVLTRIDRASKSDDYPNCREDYNRLSEYVHPNTGQNIILAWPSPKNSKFVRLSRRSNFAYITAVNTSIQPADTTSKAILHYVLDGNMPFAGKSTN